MGHIKYSVDNYQYTSISFYEDYDTFETNDYGENQVWKSKKLEIKM